MGSRIWICQNRVERAYWEPQKFSKKLFFFKIDFLFLKQSPIDKWQVCRSETDKTGAQGVLCAQRIKTGAGTLIVNEANLVVCYYCTTEAFAGRASKCRGSGGPVSQRHGNKGRKKNGSDWEILYFFVVLFSNEWFETYCMISLLDFGGVLYSWPGLIYDSRWYRAHEWMNEAAPHH